MASETEAVQEVLVSVDGEFTGPIPAQYSMISLGAVAYDHEGHTISRFKVNLKELPGASRNKETMNWWGKNLEAWDLATTNPLEADLAMETFASWLAVLPGTPKLMGWPLPVDFMFVCWYYNRFIGKPPFGYDGIDIKTLAMDRLGLPTLSETSRTKAREALGIPLTEFSHDPVDDAIQQAKIYFGFHGIKVS